MRVTIRQARTECYCLILRSLSFRVWS